MKPTENRERDQRRRRPIPWPRRVEITALCAVAFAFLAFFYVFFGGVSVDLSRIASLLGYEDSYVRHCKADLTYYLRTYENRRLVQNEVYQDAEPHDVRLAYDAQDPSGAMVRGEFRCLFRAGSAYNSDIGPLLHDVEVDGTRLPLSQTVRIGLFGPMEMQQNR